ncbi:hypothetical protein NDU88_004521 [Pleurodeles waltl]|uniref:Uncharacterized protein n=1 Tax=Pleurodeles waltl TaxID=8319 RepID=A0AAV7TRR4_PLEWA|nr:hypothetical protein NDU88_004521 [Pleurodeles waltl]
MREELSLVGRPLLLRLHLFIILREHFTLNSAVRLEAIVCDALCTRIEPDQTNAKEKFLDRSPGCPFCYHCRRLTKPCSPRTRRGPAPTRGAETADQCFPSLQRPLSDSRPPAAVRSRDSAGSPLLAGGHVSCANERARCTAQPWRQPAAVRVSEEAQCSAAKQFIITAQQAPGPRRLT